MPGDVKRKNGFKSKQLSSIRTDRLHAGKQCVDPENESRLIKDQT